MLYNQIFCLLSLLFSTACVAAALERASFEPRDTRVKQHRHRSGDLVHGEEHLLKLILSWQAIDLAAEDKGYEVCHNCVGYINEATGEEMKSTDSKRLPSSGTYGGNPIVVMPGIPKGLNTFHLRFIDDKGNASKWSKAVNLDVAEVGTAEIVEVPRDEL